MEKTAIIGKAAALILALVMILSFCSCEKKDEPVPTYFDAGYYTLSSVAGDGLSLAGEDLAAAGYVDYYLDLREDGTGKVGIAGEGMDVTWQDGTISLGETSFLYRVEVGTIVHTDEDTGNIWRYAPVQEDQTISFTTEDGEPLDGSGLQIVSIQFEDASTDAESSGQLFGDVIVDITVEEPILNLTGSNAE